MGGARLARRTRGSRSSWASSRAGSSPASLPSVSQRPRACQRRRAWLDWDALGSSRSSKGTTSHSGRSRFSSCAMARLPLVANIEMTIARPGRVAETTTPAAAGPGERRGQRHACRLPGQADLAEVATTLLMAEGIGDRLQRKLAIDHRLEPADLDGADHLQLVAAAADDQPPQAGLPGHQLGGGHLPGASGQHADQGDMAAEDRKGTRLNSSHVRISYA